VTDFTLYNLTTDGLSTPVSTSVDLLGVDGLACVNEKTALAAISMGAGDVVPAGSTYTYALYFDSTGISTAGYDANSFSIFNDFHVGLLPNLLYSVQAIDGLTGSVLDQKSVPTLPVDGGTMFY
jgi:hypothetical protein